MYTCGFPWWLSSKEFAYKFLDWEDPLEEEMATHLSILDWEITWTEEPGGLQSMGSQRVGYDLVTEQLINTVHQLYFNLKSLPP